MSENTENKRLLRVRAEKNKRRPKFIRENYYRLKRIQTTWRRPKGIDSKMRHHLKGKRKLPGSGYRGPKKVRGLHPTGMEIVQVFNVSDLEKIDTETQIAQIGSTVGSRKRIQIINTAEELDIHIINPQIRRIEEFDEEEYVEIDEFEDLDDFDQVDEEFDLLEDEDLDEDAGEEAEEEAEEEADEASDEEEEAE